MVGVVSVPVGACGPPVGGFGSWAKAEVASASDSGRDSATIVITTIAATEGGRRRAKAGYDAWSAISLPAGPPLPLQTILRDGQNGHSYASGGQCTNPVTTIQPTK